MQPSSLYYSQAADASGIDVQKPLFRAAASL